MPDLALRLSAGSSAPAEASDFDLGSLIEALESGVHNPSQGLPKEIFLFISRLTPMVNVDLLVKNEHNETLLTWREDEYYGPGWHVPGGIVRFKETTASRIQAVAANELGASVEFGTDPLAMNEVMHATRQTRGHFISLLYACRLTSPLDPRFAYQGGAAENGQWAWHATCPENLISVHGLYRKYISGTD
jgi:ADP-ribose pyrophosphatase YjhB (NUDIX family)